MKVLVTGGAGFIGVRFIRALQALGVSNILVYDNLHPQVHGENAIAPDFGPGVEFIKADIGDEATLKAAILKFRPTGVAHLVSETGTGQSHHEISRYVTANVTGTAYLLEGIAQLGYSPDWFLLTSSRAVYGEGSYVDADNRLVHAPARRYEDMKQGRFGVYGAHDQPLTAVASSSLYNTNPMSVYASTKLMQEFLVENVLGGTSTRRLIYRFQNVYGAGQSLINPYTGVLSIFMARLFKGQPIAIFEDGEIARDFVYVDDVVSAMVAGVVNNVQATRPMDIGSGVATRIYDAAMSLARLSGNPVEALPINGEFRPGDIRHAVADISYSREVLGWEPKISFAEGLTRLHAWAKEQA
ncbi:MAG: NAD-dependent epimerase/dehydratase family protein [Asticcacaulis sp.]